MVGEPCAVEGVGGRFGASAVNEERSICKKRKIKNRGNEFSSSLSDLIWKDRERERERSLLNGEERERGRIRRREERDRKKEEGDKGIVGIS